MTTYLTIADVAKEINADNANMFKGLMTQRLREIIECPARLSPVLERYLCIERLRKSSQIIDKLLEGDVKGAERQWSGVFEWAHNMRDAMFNIEQAESDMNNKS